MTDLHRDNRDMPSPCVTCAGKHYRDERDTPLGGVTVVTLSDLVPMPRQKGWGGLAERAFPSSHIERAC